MKDAAYWVRALDLEAHPEGGWFRETYRSRLRNEAGDCASTAIYFLLSPDQVSSFHRIPCDEIWHFYAGSPATIHLIHSDGRHERLPIGNENFQAVVPAHCWFGACVDEPNGWSLFGCTVAPAFEFRDFELAERVTLLGEFPQHAEIIRALTPPGD